MGSLIIGAVPDPLSWERWDEARAFLEPARARGYSPEVINPAEEALYVVLDGDELLAAATARMTEIGCEVILIGGRDHKRWLQALDTTIGAAAKQAGAARMIGIGRAGWWKELRRMGWAKCQPVEDHWLFERRL